MGLINMATNAKTRFTEVCNYLLDPHLVAWFQRICGVNGTFSGSSAEKCEQSEQLNNGSCRKNRLSESGEHDVYTGEEKLIDGSRQRKSLISGSHMKQEDLRNGILNGTGQTVGAGEPGAYTTNSLRSNVPCGSASENPTVGGGVDCISDKDSESSGKPSTLKPTRKNSLTGDVGQEFIIENKFLYYLFSFGTELGNELFYITFFPFCIWNIDPYVGRRLIIVWVWVMYLGQCAKDVIRWPRPSSPPVVKVEMFYNSEYSMPSTHAMSGTAIPFELFLLTYGRWEYPFTMGLVLAFSWCLLVCVSRIYMGMHSILDVIAGFLFSVLILVVFQPALEVIDNFNVSCQYAPLIIISLHLGMGLFSFTLDTWSTSRGDTAQILGSGAGIALGSHINHQLGLTHDPLPSQLPFAMPHLTLGLAGACLVRFGLGVVVLLLTRAVMKALTIPLVCRVAGVSTADVRKARQHMEVELPYRYIVYGTVGFNTVYLAPQIFRWLGLAS